MNKSEVIDLFDVISSAMPNVEIKRGTVEVYTELLDDMPYELARKNVLEHFKVSRFMPTPAEVRKGYTDEHERKKRETQDYLRQQEENRKKAVPCPPHIRKQLDEFFGRGKAE